MIIWFLRSTTAVGAGPQAPKSRVVLSTPSCDTCDNVAIIEELLLPPLYYREPLLTCNTSSNLNNKGNCTGVQLPLLATTVTLSVTA